MPDGNPQSKVNKNRLKSNQVKIINTIHRENRSIIPTIYEPVKIFAISGRCKM